MNKTVKRIWNIVTNILVVLVALLALTFVGGKLLGMQTFIVLSGSMEPTYPTGSLLYVNEKVETEELQEGDVITYVLAEDTLVTHRIIEVVPSEANPNAVEYRTKGDANESEDVKLVSSDDVVGTPVLCIPYMGYVADFIMNPPGRYLAIAAAALILLLMFLPDLFDDKEEEKEKKKKADIVEEQQVEQMAQIEAEIQKPKKRKLRSEAEQVEMRKKRSEAEKAELRIKRSEVEEEKPRKKRSEVEDERPRKKHSEVEGEHPRKKRSEVEGERPRKKRTNVEGEKPRKKPLAEDEIIVRKVRPDGTVVRVRKKRSEVEAMEARKKKKRIQNESLVKEEERNNG